MADARRPMTSAAPPHDTFRSSASGGRFFLFPPLVSLRLSAAVSDPELCPPDPLATEPVPSGSRMLFDPETAAPVEVSVYDRDRLEPGNRIEGPAIITEDETTTVVLSGYDATVSARSHIVLRRAP